MSTVTLNNRLFTEMATDLNNFSLYNQLDYQTQLDQAGQLLDTLDMSSPTAISSTGITWQNGALVLSLTGLNLTPVATAQEFLEAIDNGIATGTISSLSMTLNGTEILNANLGITGLSIDSGNQNLSFNGTLPTSLEQLFDLIGMLFAVNDYYLMDQSSLSDLINGLSAYGLSSIILSELGEHLVSLEIGNGNFLQLFMDGYTLTAEGEFSSNLGTMLDLINQVEKAGYDASAVSGIDLTGFTLTNASGISLLDVDGSPLEPGLASLTGTATDGDDLIYVEDFAAIISLFDPDPGAPAMQANLSAGAGNDDVYLTGEDVYWSTFDFTNDGGLIEAVIDGGAGYDFFGFEQYEDFFLTDSYVSIDLETGYVFQADVSNQELLIDFYIQNFEEVAVRGHFGVVDVAGTSGDDVFGISTFNDAFGNCIPHEVYFDGGEGTDVFSLFEAAFYSPISSGFITPALASTMFDISVNSFGEVVLTDSSNWDRPVQIFLNDVEVIRLTSETNNSQYADIAVADLITSTPLDGTSFGDTLTGTQFDDTIDGLGGDDFIYGFSGNDRLDGGDDNDSIEGGNGADTLIGGNGNDTIKGGEDEGDLRDIVYGGNGNDSIDGGYGNDELRGDGGDDSIEGGYGVDTVIGGDGNDVLTGSAWSDLIFGGNGNDFINGGFGFDRVNGGAGADKFFHTGNAGHGSDWIQDYDASQGDVLFYGAAASKSDFLVQRATTTSAGSDAVQEVFITHKASNVLLWALVDGDAQTSLNVQAGGQVFDLLA
ncbi:calcium-binding protein [Pseudoprimorskyibacter insulae]|uniref:Leukotoxin n=1 Tax=Pseudoprimorskyibacter insulae TaxID=1695997 RepID=A0A2R8AQU2_9RHOB|nr:calcium-binding protein [Pseudoprimorskyibacter insulae]SPF78204.1 Leukotoxin [Pseudoprimorskyibacter insulae]